MKQRGYRVPPGEAVEDRLPRWVAWVLLAYQIIALALFVNPWVPALEFVGFVLLGFEIALLLVWALPVFVYQLVWKRQPLRQSLRIALWSFVEALGNPF